MWQYLLSDISSLLTEDDRISTCNIFLKGCNKSLAKPGVVFSKLYKLSSEYLGHPDFNSMSCKLFKCIQYVSEITGLELKRMSFNKGHTFDSGFMLAIDTKNVYFYLPVSGILNEMFFKGKVLSLRKVQTTRNILYSVHSKEN